MTSTLPEQPGCKAEPDPHTDPAPDMYVVHRELMS